MVFSLTRMMSGLLAAVLLWCAFPAVAELRALDDVVLSEDCESYQNGQLPAGWTQVDGDGGYSSWFSRPSTWQIFSSAGYDAHSGSRFLMCHFNDGALANDDWLILPPRNLDGAITLRYWASSQDPSYPESYEVRVSLGGVQPADFVHLVASVPSVPAQWTLFEHDLSAFAGAPFRVAFRYTSTDRFALKLDDVQVEGTLLPGGAIAGTVTDDSARAIANARVEIPVLSRTAYTNTSGSYLLSDIPPGAYTVRFVHEFYYGRVETGVAVAERETTMVDATLLPRPLLFRTYVSISGSRAITDLDTVFMPIANVIRDTLVIFDLDVTVSITHSYIGDLDIWIRTPDSVNVSLVAHNSYNRGVNMTQCRFDDEAEFPFTQGVAPYTGRWRPRQPLSVLDGDSTIALRGSTRRTTWYLGVYDAALGDQGSITYFAIHVASALPVSSDEPPQERPQSFAFDGCYPNPFNATTEFRFRLPRLVRAQLVLYNLLGQEAARVLDRDLEAGEHSVFFSAGGLASGVYIARLTTPDFAASRKAILLK